MYSDSEKIWKPFSANDLQFEHIIMKPFIRKTLTLLSSQDVTLPKEFQDKISLIPSSEAIFFVKSIIPERTGISTLRFPYLRKGYSKLNESKTIVIRHFAHNENYTKFALGYPYYASMFSSLVAIILVIFLFLLYKHPKNELENKNIKSADYNNQAKKMKAL